MRVNLFTAALLLLFIAVNIVSCRKGDYKLDSTDVVISDNGEGTGTVTWTSDKSYLIEGEVYVNDGQVLTIEPGTVIRARTGQGNASSALIVARGGKIIAEGTRNKPIIFTAQGDDLQGSVELMTRGLWGGIIILGNARLNIEGGEAKVEGIPLSEPRGVYGGNDDQDNSGILRFVSIRHGGTNIGEGNEINGLTLAGVGSGTTIDHVEIISNADDGIEIFGGTVNLKNIIMAYCGDDAFDYDMGYRGKCQFLLAVEDPSIGNNMIEGDGGVNPITGTPYSIPEIYNATFIGRGAEIVDQLISFSDNAGGIIANSIFINQGLGVQVEYNPIRDDSYRQFQLGNLQIKSNIFFNIAEDSPESIFTISAEPGINVEQQEQEFQNYFSTAGNSIQDPGIFMNELEFSPFPQEDVYSGLAPYPAEWFEAVNYKGAFGTYNWAHGWSLLSEMGFIR